MARDVSSKECDLARLQEWRQLRERDHPDLYEAIAAAPTFPIACGAVPSSRAFFMPKATTSTEQNLLAAPRPRCPMTGDCMQARHIEADFDRARQFPRAAARDLRRLPERGLFGTN